MSPDISTWSLQDTATPDWEWLACADVLFSWPLGCATPWFGGLSGDPLPSSDLNSKFHDSWVCGYIPSHSNHQSSSYPSGAPCLSVPLDMKKKEEKWKGRALSWAERGRIWKGRVINLSVLSLLPSSSPQSQGEEGGEHPEHTDQRASAVGRQAGDGERRQTHHHRRGVPATGARRAQQVRGRGSLSIGNPGFQDPFSA